MQKKIYERETLGRMVFAIYVTGTENENILKITNLGDGEEYFKTISDTYVLRIIRILEHNTYANGIEMTEIISKKCRNLKLEWSCGKLL